MTTSPTPLRLLDKILMTISILIVLSSPASPRELREYGFDELIKSSEIVATVDVLEIEKRKTEHGHMRVAKFQVMDALKGTHRSEIAYLVLEDAIIQKRPHCCTPGARYLIFGTRGAHVIYEENQKHRSVLIGRDHLVSATNGRFSTYSVNNGVVNFWRHSEYSEFLNDYPDVRSSIARCVSFQHLACTKKAESLE